MEKTKISTFLFQMVIKNIVAWNYKKYIFRIGNCLKWSYKNIIKKVKQCDLNKFNVGKYDLIVSNPPYIALKDIKNLSKDIINFEPLVALKGGVEGLDLIKKVIYKSTNLLKRNGLLAIEIGHHQYRKTADILNKQGFKELSKEYDCNENIRCIISTKVKFF